MKRLAAVLLWLVLPLLAFGQGAVPLVVDGAKTVQVERVVTVKVDVLTVSAFPFSVTAQVQGASLFFWSYPAGVVAVDQGERLEVRTAPKGELLISVKALVIDWKAEKVVTRLGSVTVVVGDVPAPKPPEPPQPSDPLTAALQAAYDSLAGPEGSTRAADLARLQALHAAAVKTCADSKLTTFGQLTGAIHDAAQAMVGDRLKNLREVIAAEKRKALPSAPNAPLDAPGRALAASLETRIAAALGGVRP